MANSSLIGNILGSTIGKVAGNLAAGGQLLATGAAAWQSSKETKKARAEEQKNYEYNRDYLNSMYYRDPLSATGNRSLLKLRDEQRADNLEAMNNRAVASGATVENRLAAQKAENQTDSRLISSLLQGEDARRDRISNQQLALENQHSTNLQNQHYQNAQTWQQWGAALSDAIGQWGYASAQDWQNKGEVAGQLLLGI